MQIALLLVAAILLAYLLVSRRKASLRAKPQPAPAAAMEAAGPSEQYGPSIDEVEDEEPYVEVEPEPVVENEREPVVEIEPAYADDFAPEPVMTAQAVAAEPIVEIERESVIEVAPITFEPPVEAESADDIAPMVDPEPIDEIAPEPVVEVSPHAVDVAPPIEAEPAAEVAPEPEALLEISYPDMEEAPPGLSVDAFKDIKPVGFGGIVVEPEAQPEPEAPAPVEPEPVVEVEPEPAIEPEPVRAYDPLSYPGVEDLPPVEPEYEYEYQLEPEPAIAAAVAEPDIAEEPKPKKRGFRLPNPELKLPSFGKKKAKATTSATVAEPKASKGGLKLPQITLPPNLQGPLDDVERKIALGAVVAILAAGAFGYATAPSDDAGAIAPTPAPAAASR